KAINIEARAMIDIASKHIIPAVIRYTKNLADTVNAVTSAGADAIVQKELLDETSILLIQTKNTLKELERVTDVASQKEEGEQQANYFMTDVCPAMEALRIPVDALEMIVDKEMWPMPSYGDLIFEV
ncbi:MAG: glutamine synthetase type III, partial [Lachnospiraceae bacterium]